jgi:hypothetical protein
MSCFFNTGCRLPCSWVKVRQLSWLLNREGRLTGSLRYIFVISVAFTCMPCWTLILFASETLLFITGFAVLLVASAPVFQEQHCRVYTYVRAQKCTHIRTHSTLTYVTYTHIYECVHRLSKNSTAYNAHMAWKKRPLVCLPGLIMHACTRLKPDCKACPLPPVTKATASCPPSSATSLFPFSLCLWCTVHDRNVRVHSLNRRLSSPRGSRKWLHPVR